MTTCACPESRRPIYDRDWVVTQRQQNRSAFGGYHYQASAYSEIRCAACGAVWRTRADYVTRLKDQPKLSTRL